MRCPRLLAGYFLGIFIYGFVPKSHKSEDSDEDSDEDDPNEINNKRHAQHSAELLHLLVSDAECASHVRKLEVWALVDSNDCFPIFMGAFMFPVCITLC